MLREYPHILVILFYAHKMARNYYDPFNGLKGKPLTERELKALWLYGHNDTPAQIALRFQSTVSSVLTSLKYARQKLGAHSSWEAHEKAQRLGLYNLLSESSNPIFRIVFPPRTDLRL